jgi:hypothetical protein
LDEFIRFAFEEQSRMVVSFMLLLIIGADVFRTKKKKIYRDFVRRYIRDQQNHKAPAAPAAGASGAATASSVPDLGVMDFTRMKQWEIIAWAEANANSLVQAKEQYIQDDIKKKAEDEKTAREAQEAAEGKRDHCNLIGLDSLKAVVCWL